MELRQDTIAVTRDNKSRALVGKLDDGGCMRGYGRLSRVGGGRRHGVAMGCSLLEASEVCVVGKMVDDCLFLRVPLGLGGLFVPLRRPIAVVE